MLIRGGFQTRPYVVFTLCGHSEEWSDEESQPQPGQQSPVPNHVERERLGFLTSFRMTVWDERASGGGGSETRPYLLLNWARGYPMWYILAAVSWNMSARSVSE